MTTKRCPLRTSITSDKQAYVDEPVYVDVTPIPIALAVSEAVARMCTPPDRELRALVRRDMRFLSHYEHTRLRWMKPDGKGGLVPKYG